MHKRKYGDRSERRRNANSDRGNKHPSHLKGKQIGLFYAKRNAENSISQRKKPLGAILLSSSRRDEIQEILASTNFKKILGTDHDNNQSYDYVKDSLFKRDFLRSINGSIDDKLVKASGDLSENRNLSDKYYNEQLLKNDSLKYKEMLQKRKKLPAYKMRLEILELVHNNQVTVISGETGCGKTTQVAQFILEDFIERKIGSQCKILCTQPRRISAIAVAQRVADERNEQLGKSVGYQIRLEKVLPRDSASICFCTTGVILRQMQTDPSLSNISHLILDEIHERDIMSDFILALIKKVIEKRQDLKVILMSATLDAEKFSKYYNCAPRINIPGFTYPVQEFYLEDVLKRTGYVFQERVRVKQEKRKEYDDMIGPYIRLLRTNSEYSKGVCEQLKNPISEEINIELIYELIVSICEKESDQGAILVFLTGFSEISTLTKTLQKSPIFPSNKYLIFPLHSLMPTFEQKQIFEKPPAGKRKIIIATNIAETSITIDDVVFVIDCGKVKMTSFDTTTGNETLAAEWVALANANQRRGRAGRVKPGICFHLFSKARNAELQQYQLPEILRSRLENVILTAKSLQLGEIARFFSELIDSPDPEAVSMALNLLKRMNALTDDEKLTPLGYHLAKLPIAPQMGKMILFGAIFSCVDPILSIAATLDFKDPFQLPVGQEKQVTEVKLKLANGIKSDHLLFHEVLKQFEQVSDSRRFCWDNYLNCQTMKQLLEMKKQFMEYLHDMNFVPSSDFKSVECNRNSTNLSLIKAVICAGLYPNVTISHVLGKRPCFTMDLKRVKLHPKSVLSYCTYFDTNILIYYRKLFSCSNFIHDGTLIHPLPVVFFGDRFQKIVDDGRNMISINDSLKFVCSENTTAIIEELRDHFNWFLQYKISHPGPVYWDNDETKVLKVIIELITFEDLEVYDDDTFEDRD